MAVSATMASSEGQRAGPSAHARALYGSSEGGGRRLWLRFLRVAAVAAVAAAAAKETRLARALWTRSKAQATRRGGPGGGGRRRLPL